ncbi:MAG: 1-acyl-sn-glycerol-3-phosphate acyltransferase [Chloroflexi bacterium]|nr:lysophospholipid acyltransferase family protein [Chloroflexota bacterium]MQC27331.1 1-acyl-sn-glycerol-3-phosphate acyltransferase [Chloroflexota bacterium]
MVLLKRRIIRTTISVLLRLVANIRVEGWDKLKAVKGRAIVASNHLGRLDAGLALMLMNRDDVILVVAEKYRDYPFFRWMVKQLDLLWLERFEVDLGTLKEVLRRLAKGGILMIAPEGTRSTTEALLEGKPGVAYIAAKSGAPVIPAAVFGSEDRAVRASFKRLRRPKITIRVGEPFIVPTLPKQARDVFLRKQTEEIMAQIAALLPSAYHGVYAEHPRVVELLSSKGLL